MLPVLERFGGKPIRCCLSEAAAATTEKDEAEAAKPAYIWDFARMREGPPAAVAVGGAKGGGSGLLMVSTPASAGDAEEAGATPTSSSSSGSDEAALLPQQSTHTAALALVPVTEHKLADEIDDDAWCGGNRHLPAYLEERRYRFSRAPLKHLQMAGALGLVNLVGAMWLLDQWRLFPPPTSTALYGVSRALACYAWAFLLFPLLRLALIARWNRGLKRRNALRRFLLDDFKARAADGASDLHRKLEFAARYRAHALARGGRGAF